MSLVMGNSTNDTCDVPEYYDVAKELNAVIARVLQDPTQYHDVPKSMRSDVLKGMVHDAFVADPSYYEKFDIINGGDQFFTMIVEDLIDISRENFASVEFCNRLYDVLMCHEYTAKHTRLRNVLRTIHHTTYIINDIVENHVTSYLYIAEEMITEKMVGHILAGLRDCGTIEGYSYKYIFHVMCEHYPHLMTSTYISPFVTRANCHMMCDFFTSNMWTCDLATIASESCPYKLCKVPLDKISSTALVAMINRNSIGVDAYIRLVENYPDAEYVYDMYDDSVIDAYCNNMKHTRSLYRRIKKLPQLWKILNERDAIDTNINIAV
jgi:hypothetical protein